MNKDEIAEIRKYGTGADDWSCSYIWSLADALEKAMDEREQLIEYLESSIAKYESERNKLDEKNWDYIAHIAYGSQVAYEEVLKVVRAHSVSEPVQE